MDKSQFYMCFTLSHDEDEAARRFVEKYGRPPEVIEEEKLLIWMGPVPVNSIQSSVSSSVRAGAAEKDYAGHTGTEGEGSKSVSSGPWEVESDGAHG